MPALSNTSFPRSDHKGSRLPLVIRNVRLAHQNKLYENYFWVVECTPNGKVRHVERSQNWSPSKVMEAEGFLELDAQGALMLPSLCHAHIHLDKCFLLDMHSDAPDILIGDFDEAMRVTARAKRVYAHDPDDLYRRGKRVIVDSLESGVTSMRAHVEIDEVCRYSCLNAATRLQHEYQDLCAIDIAVFAQEVLFTYEDEPTQNQVLLRTAASAYGVSAVGSAPYVETSFARSCKNIEFILDLAFEFGLFVDFHLDYNLSPAAKPLIFEVITQTKLRLSQLSQTSLSQARPTITIGHATRLQLFSPAEWQHLLTEIKGLREMGMSLFLVSLPQSDIYMQGREQKDTPLGAPRGTLRVTQLKRTANLNVAMACNNVANMFTPQGSLDPLSLCSFGVAIFQAATPEDIRTLVRSVTVVAKHAIGQTEVVGLFPSRNEPADFVLLHGTKTLNAACLNPSHDRTTIYQGKVVSRRITKRWIGGRHSGVRTRRKPWYRRFTWRLLFFHLR